MSQKVKEIGVLASVVVVLLLMAWGGTSFYRWWTRPAPPLPGINQADIIRQQQARDTTAIKQQGALIQALSESNRKLQEDLVKLKAEIAARHDAPLQEAARKGPDALARLASTWWAPGTLAALKAQKWPD